MYFSSIVFSIKWVILNMKGPKTDPCGIPQNRKQYGANGANSVKSNSSFNWIKYINFKLALWYIISTENANKWRKIKSTTIFPISVFFKNNLHYITDKGFPLPTNEYIENLPNESSKLFQLHFVHLDESIISITIIYDTRVTMRSQRSLAIIICTKLKFTFTFPESSSSLGYTLASSKCHDLLSRLLFVNCSGSSTATVLNSLISWFQNWSKNERLGRKKQKYL